MFFDWLETNEAEWLDYLKKNGGEAASLWIENNRVLIQNKSWSEIFIPRSIFGKYLDERVDAVLSDAREIGLASLDRAHAEAIDLRRQDDGSFRILLAGADRSTHSVTALRTVLAIGSPPTRKLDIPPERRGSYGFIDDIYCQDADLNLKQIYDVLKKVANAEDRNIFIVGSNASALEMLYCLSKNALLIDLINKIIVVSLSGALPQRLSKNGFADQSDDLPIENLDHILALRQRESYSALDLMHAIEKDLNSNYSAGKTIGEIDSRLGSLVSDLIGRLDYAQREIFYDKFGMKVTKILRRAGPEYSDAAAKLIEMNKLDLVRGRFLGMAEQTNGAAALRYSDGDDDQAFLHPRGCALLINCCGFEELDHSSSALIDNVIKRGLCKVNKTNRGFVVNEQFEASRDLYAMGPLLGGIFTPEHQHWHVENARRIYNLAADLAVSLCGSLIGEAGLSVVDRFKRT